MNVLSGDRQTGKTTTCIRRAQELGENGECVYIVTVSQQRAEYIFSLARKIGADIRYPLTYYEIISGKYSANNVDVFIFDDLLDFLPALCPSVTIDTVIINTPSIDQLERNSNVSV